MHFVNDGCDAGVHSNDGGVGCIPDRCNSTLSRSTGRAGSRLLTHARCTLSQNNSTALRHVSLSHHVISLDTRRGVTLMGLVHLEWRQSFYTSSANYRSITCTCLFSLFSNYSHVIASLTHHCSESRDVQRSGRRNR